MKSLRSKVILASAGTGKTWQLTTWYLQLLLAGVEPDRILATTFTRKAAGEIFERVLGRLLEALESEGGLADLARAIEDPGLSRARCLNVLGKFVRALDKVAICTLDSFFMRLATAFSLDLMLPSGWSIAEENTLAALRERAIGEIVDAEDPAALLGLVRLLLKHRHSAHVLGAIRRTVDGIYHAALGAPAEAWEAIAPRGHMLRHERLETLRRTFSALGVPRNAGGAGKENANWVKAKPALAELMKGNDWEGFLAHTLVCKLGDGDPRYYGVDIPDEWRRALEPLIGHFQALALEVHAGYNRATRDLLERFDSAYRAQKELHGAYGFEDVPRALLTADACGDLQHLYYRLDGRLDHVLLDEFQDTSLTQFRLLEPIIDEIVTRADEGRSLFCVGDIKQALYQWRNAEPELLPSIPRKWDCVEQETLEESRRSAPVIIGAVNSVLGTVRNNAAFVGREHDDSAAAADWAANFRQHRTVKAGVTGYACLRVAPQAPGAGAQSQARAALACACERVAELIGRDPNLSVGVLVPARKNISRLIHLLRERGVEASEESGNSVCDSPAVAVALSLLHLVDHPGDTAAQFHVGLSPLGRAVGLTYPAEDWRVRELASGIRRALLEEGYAAVLSRWLSQVTPACDARDLARFEQLIELALEFDGRSGLRAVEFVEMARQRRVEAPTRAGVRVMTVHASKGLEFDAVVLPELEGLLTGMPPAVLVARDGPLGPVQAIARYPSAVLRRAHPLLAEMHARWRRREIGEQLCLLYVAMTRARRHLEMIIHPRPKPELPLTYAGLLRGALGAADSPAAADSVPWEDGIERWAASGDRARPAPPTMLQQTPVVVRLKPADASSLRHLARRSPSSLGAGYTVDLRAHLSLAGAQAAERGRLFHAWFELIEWLDDGVPGVSALLEAARRLGTQTDVSGHLRDFRECLTRARLRDLLSKESYIRAWGKDLQLIVHRERAFAGRDADPQSGLSSLLTGRLDRLVIGARDGKPFAAEIVDYKTDAPGTQTDAADLARAYSPQMRAYQRATARMLGLDHKDVSVKLALVAADLVVAILPE